MTLKEAYELAVKRTLVDEGRWYDGSGAHDPNPTMYGVTQGVYDYWCEHVWKIPTMSVRWIKTDQLHQIARSYWDNAKLDLVADLFPLTAMALFDMSYNAGDQHAVKALQRALGVVDDGVFGKLTLEALRKYNGGLDYTGADVIDRTLAERVCFERLNRYLAIVDGNPVKHRSNLPSWLRRVLKFRNELLR